MTNDSTTPNELTLYFKPEDIAELLKYQPNLITLKLNVVANDFNGTPGAAITILAQGIDASGASIGRSVGPCPYPCHP